MRKTGIVSAAVILALAFLYRISVSLPASSFIITPSGNIESVYAEKQTLYKIESSDEDFILYSTANQRIITSESSEGRSTVLLTAGESDLPAEKDFSRYLKNTPFLNIDNASIKKTAAGFKNSKNPVKDVSVFVYRHITDKKIGIPLISAPAILSRRSGDCTEHTVLTVSLLRAMNIPARAVMGIILAENFSGRSNVFVYHMWAEAFTGGRWILVDSTRPESIHYNRYIAFANHNLMTEIPLEYLQAVSTMQNMKISYLR